MAPGAPIQGRVLDVSKKDGIVDLSLKAALTSAAAPRKAKAGKKAAAAAAATLPEVKCPGLLVPFLVFLGALEQAAGKNHQ